MKLPFLKVAIPNLFSKPSTVPYPAVPSPAKPDYRGRIAYDGDKCINCGTCIKVCSPQAITRTAVDTEDGQDITYEFDMTSCTFCGMCQDFCDSGAIHLTDDYHMVATDPKDLITTGVCHKKTVKGLLTVSDACVYCTLCARKCPEGAITVDRANKTWAVDHDKCTKCGTCIGTCPKKALSFAEPVEEVVTCDTETCVYCTLCAKKCPMSAIEVFRAEKEWKIDYDSCTKCGTCIASCPKKALSMQPKKD